MPSKQTKTYTYKPEEKHVQTEHLMQHRATKSSAGNRGFGTMFSEIP